MFKLIILSIAFLTGAHSWAVPQRMFRDLKLPTQQMVERQAFAIPLAASTSAALLNNAGNTSTAAASATTFLAQPDVSRNVVITPGGSTADVAACTIVVSGTSYSGASISENFVFTNNQSAAVTGSKAFRTLTGVSFPANCEDGGFAATWSVGYGEKLGLKNCLDFAGNILFSTFNGAKEGTAPTMAADAANIEGNTADFNGAMNGSNNFELFFFQNFRCP